MLINRWKIHKIHMNNTIPHKEKHMDLLVFLNSGGVVRATCHNTKTENGWLFLVNEKGTISKAFSAHNVSHIDFSPSQPIVAPDESVTSEELGPVPEWPPKPTKPEVAPKPKEKVTRKAKAKKKK
jgi:hypothetical protein